MTRNSTVATWAIVIIVILIILGVWWYYSQADNTSLTNNTNSTAQTQTQTQTKSSAKQITSFVFEGLTPAATANINPVSYMITATVPSNTDVKKLTPTITVSPKSTVTPASGTEKDFTNPVVYTVTAEDGTTQNYMVTVTKAAQ